MPSVHDDFNRADGLIGANYTDMIWWSQPQVISNQCGDGQDHTNGAYWSADTFPANQWAECNYTPATTGHNSKLCVRVTTDVTNGPNFYFAELEATVLSPLSYLLAVGKCINGSAPEPGSWLTSQITVTDPVVRLNVVGSHLTCETAPTHGGTYTEVLSCDDSALTSGQPGMYFETMTGAGIDDFYAADIVFVPGTMWLYS